MKSSLIRFFSALLVSALFFGVLFYQPNNDYVPVITQDIPVTRVGVKIKTPQVANIETHDEPITEVLEVVQPTFEDIPEILEDHDKREDYEEPQEYDEQHNHEEHDKQQEQGGTNERIFIDSYLDVTSVSEGLVLPELDLSKMYSRIVYPASMRRKNIECSFDIRVFVDEKGNVTYRIPSDINEAFAQSISKAFKGIKAKPALYKEKPVDVTFTLPVEFVLK